MRVSVVNFAKIKKLLYDPKVEDNIKICRIGKDLRNEEVSFEHNDLMLIMMQFFQFIT